VPRKPPQFEVGDTVCPGSHGGCSFPETGTVIEPLWLRGPVSLRGEVRRWSGRGLLRKRTVFDTPDGM